MKRVAVYLTLDHIRNLVNDYNRLHLGGGACHIVLDDGNVEHHHVDMALRDAAADGDTLGALIMEALLPLTIAERKAVVPAAARDDE